MMLKHKAAALLSLLFLFACVARAQDVATPPSMEPGKIYPVRTSGQNHGAKITIANASITDRVGSLKAAPGRRFFVLATEWENIIEPKRVNEKLLPTAYKIPNLIDHLYLLYNGSHVARLIKTDTPPPGHLAMRDFTIAKIGDRVRGNVIFDLPESASVHAAELRFYDYTHGHAAVSAFGPALAPVAPLVRTQSNDVIEAGVFGVKKQPEHADVTAPEGMQWVLIDFRAAGRFKVEAESVIFNGYGQPEEKIKVNNFADWTDSHSYLQLVIDNNRAYTPQPQSTLPPSPRFLPDILSGGTVAFLAPMTAQSMELMCAFPNARTQDGKILKPYPLTFLLEGKVSQGVTPKPIASIEDGKMFTVWFYGQKIGQTFAGKTAESGKRFVIVDVEVRNRSDTGETFQIKEQLKFLESEKNQIPPDDATYAGVYRPTELMYIPSDEQRRFEVAYQLPLEQLNPRLAYNGVTKAEVVDLVRIAPTAAKDNKHNVIAGAQTPAKPTDHQPIAAANAESKTPLPELIEVKGKRFPSRVPIKPSIKAKGLEGYGLTQEQVNAAIDKGAAGLWQVIHEEDIVKNKQKFGDQNAHMLAALALVHSDYHKKSPEFDKHLRSYMTKYDPAFDNHTYKAGLFCMLVEAYEDTAFLPQLKKATRWMIENQGKEGSWGYGVNLRDPALLGGAPPRRVLKVAGGKPLDGSDIPAPMARTTPWEKGEDGDNSVTQYAILGMHAAGRGRVKSTPELWKRALENQMSRQYENGGWAYTSGFSTYGAMTAAGVCALAISGHELGAEAPPHLQEGIERGLAWLSANFTVVDHPNGSINWKHYYLYSLERVGRILDTEFIGEHEWYPVGASHLLSTQREDGAWIGKGEEENPRYATSFALMFLTRKTATLGQEVVKTGPGTLKTAVNLPPGRKVYIILDASGSMLAEMDGRPKFEIAREAVRGLIDAFTPQTEVALRAYGYRKRATDEGASEDSAMLIPMGPIGDKKKLLDIVSGLRARGKTPLAFSLEQALSEVPAGTDDEPVTVLLLTDGGEDTQPRKDPVAASKPYAKLKNVRFRIVGFDINRQDWSDQLIAMAKAGNGMYLPAANSSALIQELKSAVFETPETFTVLNDKQQQVAAGKFGESAQLPEGKYTLKTQYADRAYEEIFWINAGMNTSVTFEAANVNAENDAASPTDAADPTSPAVEEPTPTKPPVKKPPVALPPPREVPAGKLPNPPAERKTCDQCGSSVAGNAKFCTKCGSRMD